MFPGVSRLSKPKARERAYGRVWDMEGFQLLPTDF